jgi:regulatory protein
MALALQALGRKERTESEMVAWLRERGVGEEELEEVISQLIASGGLDDASFARRFAEDKRDLAGWGSERIRESLHSRGVAAADVEAAVAVEPYEEELERAVGLLDAGAKPVETDTERSRALAFLTRRGYAYETAYEAVRRREQAA